MNGISLQFSSYFIVHTTCTMSHLRVIYERGEFYDSKSGRQTFEVTKGVLSYKSSENGDLGCPVI